MKKYKLYIRTGQKEPDAAMLYNEDGSITSFIFDNDSNEYRTYLQWIEEGNTPEPADPLLEPTSLTPQEKLAASGLTVNELKSLLGLK